MKDPCNECLVSVMCTQVCWDKANYEALLLNSLELTRGTPQNSDIRIKYYKHRKTLKILKDRRLSLK